MMTTSKLGIYIHIPFCVRKCKYCSFLSFGCSESNILSEYANAIVEEIKIKSNDWHFREVDTVYIGGGTPSILSQWDIEKIMDALDENFYITQDAEITIEANPATLSDDKMEKYLRKNINRLSLGVQSFDNFILNVLGRSHDKNDAFYSLQRAQKLGFKNISLDIMFGIPGQNMKMWKDTVRQCIFLKPQHISLYSLQVEEGTQIYNEIYEKRCLKETSEESDRDMYHNALKMLRESGYNQYEISNTALPGYESRHNLKYWSYDEYIGIGLGASSFAKGERFSNYRKMSDYISAIKKKSSPRDDRTLENNSLRDEMGIFVFTGLRKADGIYLPEFYKNFQVEFFNVYSKNILNKYRGLLTLDDDRLFLTENGMDVSNKIMAEFI